MGGIGAGMICLEGTGALSHVSLRNRPEVFNEPLIFAALCVKGKSAKGNLGRLLKSIRVGKDLPKDKTAALAAATQANTLFQAAEMLQQSDVLKELVRGCILRWIGRLTITPLTNQPTSSIRFRLRQFSVQTSRFPQSSPRIFKLIQMKFVLRF